MGGCKVAGKGGARGRFSEGFSYAEKSERGMRGFHCLTRSMPVESGDEVSKSLELQQQQTIDCRELSRWAVITHQHQS